MLKVLMASAVAGGALMAAMSVASAADPYTFALVPKNTNNPFFDQALRRLQEGREGIERRGRSASISAPASTAAATRKRRSSRT